MCTLLKFFLIVDSTNHGHRSHNGKDIRKLRRRWRPETTTQNNNSARVLSLSLGSLSKDVFRRRTSTLSVPLFILICLVATKSVLLSFFTHIETICPKIRARSLPKKAKGPLTVDERRSKTALLKFSNPFIYPIKCDATEINVSPRSLFKVAKFIKYRRSYGHTSKFMRIQKNCASCIYSPLKKSNTLNAVDMLYCRNL